MLLSTNCRDWFLLVLFALNNEGDTAARRSKRGLHAGFEYDALDNDFGAPSSAPFGGPLTRPFPLLHQFDAPFGFPFPYNLPSFHTPFYPPPPPPIAQPYHYAPPPLALPPVPPPPPPGPPPAPIIVSPKTAATLSVASLIHALIARKFYPQVIPFPVPVPVPRPVPVPVPVKVPVPIFVKRPDPITVVRPILYGHSIKELDGTLVNYLHASFSGGKSAAFKGVLSPFIDEEPISQRSTAHFFAEGPTKEMRSPLEKVPSSFEESPSFYKWGRRSYEEEHSADEHQDTAFEADVYKEQEDQHWQRNSVSV